MRIRLALVAVILGVVGGGTTWAQASAIPSAQTGPGVSGADRGRKLLDQMVEALGGDKWLNLTEWTLLGKGATFYKGAANPYVSQFEELHRPDPFGVRIVIISRLGVFIPTEHRDVAVVWTPDNGYEVTYKGKTALPKADVDEYELRRKHTIDVVVKEWLKQPGVLVSYEGTKMSDRRLVDQISVLTATNDAVEIQIDANTHLPVSRTFQYRDEQFKDLDTDVEQYDDYHPFQGIMTAMTITRLHNGDMVSQRFLTKISYNNQISPDLFNPDRPLEKKVK